MFWQNTRCEDPQDFVCAFDRLGLQLLKSYLFASNHSLCEADPKEGNEAYFKTSEPAQSVWKRLAILELLLLACWQQYLDLVFLFKAVLRFVPRPGRSVP